MKLLSSIIMSLCLIHVGAAQEVCSISNTTWRNTVLPVQTDTFTVTYDDTPNAAGIDGLVGLSQAPATGYTQFAILTRFSTANRIDALDSTVYRATTIQTYVPGTRYHFRVAINIPAKRYSAFVMPLGGAEYVLAQNFRFRAEQSGVTSLGYWGFRSGTSTATHTVCNFTLVTVARPVVASVLVSPNPATITVGSAVDFAAAVKDAAGNVLLDRLVSWASTMPTVLTVNNTGEAVALQTGLAQVVATADGVSGSADVTVQAVPPPKPAIVLIPIYPLTVRAAIGDTVDFFTVAVDNFGRVTACAPTWTVSDTMLATVQPWLPGSNIGRAVGRNVGTVAVRASCGTAIGEAQFESYAVVPRPAPFEITQATLQNWGLLALVPGAYLVQLQDSTAKIIVRQRFRVVP